MPLVSAAALVFGLSAGWSTWGRAVDLWAYDFLLRLHPPEPGPSASVILAIDEETLDAHGACFTCEPRSESLDIVCRHEPAAVAIDIILSEPGEEDANRALEQALLGCPNVVPAAHLTSSLKQRTGKARSDALHVTRPPSDTCTPSLMKTRRSPHPTRQSRRPRPPLGDGARNFSLGLRRRNDSGNRPGT